MLACTCMQDSVAEKGTHFHPRSEKITPCVKGGTGWRTEKSIYPRSQTFLNCACSGGPFAVCSESIQYPVLCVKELSEESVPPTFSAESILYNFLLFVNPHDAACKFKEFQASTETLSPPPELSYEHLLFTRVQAKSCQTCSTTSTLTQRLPGRDVCISCKDALSQTLKRKSANTAQPPTVKANPSLFNSFSNTGSLTS